MPGMIRVSWAIEGHAVGAADVPDVAAAVKAVTDALRAVLAPYAPDVRAHALTGSMAPLRYLMLTDGQSVHECGEWSGASGIVSVQLALLPG